MEEIHIRVLYAWKRQKGKKKGALKDEAISV